MCLVVDVICKKVCHNFTFYRIYKGRTLSYVYAICITYHTLQIFGGGKLLRYTELNCNSLETFVVKRQSCTGYFTGKVLQLPIDLMLFEP